MDPEQVHQIGLQEVARIEGEELAIAKKLGFSDLKSFREQFVNLSQEQVFETLKARLKPICHRTLRRQVTAYVPFTSRFALVEAGL